MKTYFVCDNSMQPTLRKGDFITLKKPASRARSGLLMVERGGRKAICRAGESPRGSKLLGVVDRVFQVV